MSGCDMGGMRSARCETVEVLQELIHRNSQNSSPPPRKIDRTRNPARVRQVRHADGVPKDAVGYGRWSPPRRPSFTLRPVGVARSHVSYWVKTTVELLGLTMQCLYLAQTTSILLEPFAPRFSENSRTR
jgi:hypothetical protein